MTYQTEKLALREHQEDSFEDISNLQLDDFIKQNEQPISPSLLAGSALAWYCCPNLHSSTEYR